MFFKIVKIQKAKSDIDYFMIVYIMYTLILTFMIWKTFNSITGSKHIIKTGFLFVWMLSEFLYLNFMKKDFKVVDMFIKILGGEVN